ncbi:polyhydroxyalkanoate synthesis repressor PhaR [Paraneptunicella aestuarii]|uniref:polyhydroxyalkanoate synthesis repressor PhaR n=1 Tax=Paraneptunicella aestuarii TaxID=2831148 RepID=UPI001E293195|nr:polyhydroxyalkanoate synthesis repressor PhaR [Paraneptunicella aestuarii]UAA37327.1 polyhydroxyalkanoate synthesis repressor PhaR [Paraneptunicella aestuarii]
MITIKKYPNRRLYDTSQSQYVNLDYLKQLIIEHKDFQVVDSKTGNDLTKSILLQIITESETNEQQSILTNTLLKQLIRFYGGNMQSFLRQYLEQSLATFMEQQDAMQGIMKNLIDASPMGMFNKMMEQNMNSWTGKKTKNEDKE